MEIVIQSVIAREILDSRGNPTVEAQVDLSDGRTVFAAVPSGASTGSHEAFELRDGQLNRYGGKGVRQAVRHVNEIIAPKLKGRATTDQIGIDRTLIELDGTRNKMDLGANAILAVSMAVARGGALASEMPLFRYLGGCNAHVLPVPMMNILNGGVHANNGLEIQEFMVMPIRFGTFSEALRAGVEIFHTLARILTRRNLATGVGDEGGFAPQLRDNTQALELVTEAIEKAGYRPGENVFIALDVAASEFVLPQDEPASEGESSVSYRLEEHTYSSEELVELWSRWSRAFPIISIEDGCAEDDWTGWRALTRALGNEVQLVGDDLFVTNVERLRMGVEQGVANALLVKPNQIGTVSETITTMEMARLNGYRLVVSHRSGETDDPFIADLAVGMNSGQIKTGSASRSERMSKYNQLLRIEESLGSDALYAGRVQALTPGGRE
ncbi:MAG: phosphopyruvate hydratase [Planctomycetia bacterium]|nr:phosphopyruvate hydratase [Planctomycetia bacterium]